MNIAIIFLTFFALTIVSFVALMIFGEKVKGTNKKVPRKNYVLAGIFFGLLILTAFTGIWRSSVAVRGVYSYSETEEKQIPFEETSLETHRAIIGFKTESENFIREFPTGIVKFEKAPEGQTAIAKIEKTRSVRGVKILGIWLYAKGTYTVTSVTLYVP